MNISIFWFRRDLRLEDNAGLFHALNSGIPILPVFIFDDNILHELHEADARINFIYATLKQLHSRLKKHQSSLLCLKGNPLDVFRKLLEQHSVQAVYTNKDYEPYAITRDSALIDMLAGKNIPLKTYQDHVVFEENDVLKKDGKPYTIYTPYKNAWLQLYNSSPTQSFDPIQVHNFYPSDFNFPELTELGFKTTPIQVKPYDLSEVKNYLQTRDFPVADGTSYLGPHLRFGTVSVRQILAHIQPGDETFRNQLIWREFFIHILFHFPSVVTHNFKKKYDGIQWRNNLDEFELWCQGKTGYPLVDAGMRQLNQTGYMHNRVRMVVASFLCKHLLIDWRWGEAYFAQHLLDYELASNNGNWQWSAGTGCDSAPYFRVFNPTTQLEKFDKQLVYVKKWVPEYGTAQYTLPMVDHAFARTRALESYKIGINSVSL
jgi:deoxyribodipyrimidine photo-lyase